MQYCSNQLIQNNLLKIAKCCKSAGYFVVLFLAFDSSFRLIRLVTINQLNHTSDRQHRQDQERYKPCRLSAHQQRKQQP